MTGGDELEIRELGLVPYQQAWELQRRLQQRLMRGEGLDALILCEHPAVITLGRRARPENVLADAETLAAEGVQLLDIERGGDVTWHGPGQLVCYPIVDLNRKKRDVHWYVRGLEEVVIRTLAAWGLRGVRQDGKSGVWITPVRKISSVGVRISRWCTLHGFSLNVRNCQRGFALIRPCGLPDVAMTSIEEELQEAGRAPALSTVAAGVARQFKAVFNYH